MLFLLSELSVFTKSLVLSHCFLLVCCSAKCVASRKQFDSLRLDVAYIYSHILLIQCLRCYKKVWDIVVMLVVHWAEGNG